jgi:integrase/recombinase XerD
MPDKKEIPIAELMDAANMELIRLDFKSSARSRHSKEFRNFTNYCDKNGIYDYSVETGPQYFEHCYGLDVGDTTIKLTQQQLDTRCSVRFLDDIFQFGYALRYSHHDYSVPPEYANLLEEYLAWCHRNNSSSGTIRVKRTKIRQFFCFLNGRRIPLSNLTSTDISEFMTTLCRYHRATINVFSSVLRDFLRYLSESGIIETDLSSTVPKPKIYVEETIPETWTPEEVHQLLASIDRNNAIGKRDYAMLLLAVILGMRAGDICTLKFKNLDWHQKLIIYTQQKTKKVNTLPLLPVVGDAIIDYLKNGRLESECDSVFIRHVHPYGEFQSSTALSSNLKRYICQAGLTRKKRKLAHSLRHTLASCLLREGTPLMTISNVLGHHNPQTTTGYLKVDIAALRKCALSYGGKEA